MYVHAPFFPSIQYLFIRKFAKAEKEITHLFPTKNKKQFPFQFFMHYNFNFQRNIEHFIKTRASVITALICDPQRAFHTLRHVLADDLKLR